MSDPARTVLVVDDSETVHRMLDWVLRPAGLALVHASSGKEALALLARQKVDLAIVDLNMPEMDGVELIRAVRKTPEGRDLPMLMLTTERREVDVKMALDAGANMYLTKPSTPQVIRYKVLSMLGLPEAPPAEGKA